MADLFVGHDLGTGGDKAALVDIEGRVLRSHVSSFALSHPRPGWAEQEPADWWAAVCEGTRAVAEGFEEQIGGIAFAGQMLSLAPVDAAGNPTRPAISWLDTRAGEQAARLNRRLGGAKVVRAIAGAAATAKDLIPKMAWIRQHEPDVHAATASYGDATSYLVAKATGRLALDPTAAGATGLFDPSKRRWSGLLAKAAGFPLDKMAPVLRSVDTAGGLSKAAAEQLGLPAGTPVAMGMADIPAAAVGSGAVEPGDAHVYLGTSSWIAVTLARPRHVPTAGIVSVASADPQACLMIAESETAGACREWLISQLGLDDEAFEALAGQAPAGSGGLLFCPWMFGERSPYPDSEVRGAFVNMSLEHDRAHMARAVLEGVALNLRWILAEIDGTKVRSRGLRAIGGGAHSNTWLQVIADACQETVTRVREPRMAGAVGAALVAAVAVGALPGVLSIKERVQVERSFEPTPSAGPTYERAYRALRALAPSLSRTAHALKGS